MSRTLSSRFSDGSSWKVVVRHFARKEFQLSFFRFTLAVRGPRRALCHWSPSAWCNDRCQGFRWGHVVFAAKHEEASDMSMGDVLPFVLRCVPSPVFKTTRFKVWVNSITTLLLRSVSSSEYWRMCIHNPADDGVLVAQDLFQLLFREGFSRGHIELHNLEPPWSLDDSAWEILRVLVITELYATPSLINVRTPPRDTSSCLSYRSIWYPWSLKVCLLLRKVSWSTIISGKAFKKFKKEANSPFFGRIPSNNVYGIIHAGLHVGLDRFWWDE